MTRRSALDRFDATLRELDPAATSTLTEEERRRAGAVLAQILAAPAPEPGGTEAGRPRGRRRRALVPAALATAAVVALTTVLGGGSAFADWSAVPTVLPAATAAAAATTCRSNLGIGDPGLRVVLGEQRGGWTYVLLDGPGGEGACLMPDHMVGTSDATARRSGFFGTYDTEHEEAPTPARDSIVETESMVGVVTVPGRLPLRTVDGLFTWTTGYAGRDVARVTVDPPVGPDVVASLEGGRFSAWWPSGRARGDNPAMSQGWSYTVTLTDGTTRRV
jgi:hypothetical protein